jgi:hypothetical protein
MTTYIYGPCQRETKSGNTNEHWENSHPSMDAHRGRVSERECELREGGPAVLKMTSARKLFDGVQDSYGGGGVAALGMPMRV